MRFLKNKVTIRLFAAAASVFMMLQTVPVSAATVETPLVTKYEAVFYEMKLHSTEALSGFSDSQEVLAEAVPAEDTADTSAAEEESTITGEDVVEYALQFVGNPYKWGGSSLTEGTDCSGFTMSVYANFGISLPHSSSSQRSCGVSVSMDELEPGDIICYSGHVALYIGDGQIVHAAGASSGIIVSDIDYCGTPICARRVLQ